MVTIQKPRRIFIRYLVPLKLVSSRYDHLHLDSTSSTTNRTTSYSVQLLLQNFTQKSKTQHTLLLSFNYILRIEEEAPTRRFLLLQSPARFHIYRFYVVYEGTVRVSMETYFFYYILVVCIEVDVLV